MISSFMVYALLILDNIHGLFSTLTITGVLYFIILAIVTFVCFMVSIDSDNCDAFTTPMNYIFIKNKIYHFLVGGVLLISLLIGSLLPTTKQMTLIYILPKVINNEKIQQLPENITDFVNSYLKELTSDLKDSTKNIDIQKTIKDEVKTQIEKTIKEK